MLVTFLLDIVIDWNGQVEVDWWSKELHFRLWGPAKQVPRQEMNNNSLKLQHYSFSNAYRVFE